MKYKITKQVEIRSEPSFDNGSTFGVLQPGFIIDIMEEVRLLNSDHIWLKDPNGFFYLKEATEEALLTIEHENIRLNLNLKAPWLNGNFDVSPVWPTATGRGITVAIIDSGIYQHPDIAANIDGEHQKTFIGNTMADNDGHGTHVAGIIGARGKRDLAGVAPNATLLPIKVVEREGDHIDSSRLNDAIAYAASISKVKIINLSLKTNPKDTNYNKLKATIQNAVSKGVIFVAASGNDWGNFVASPANLESIIAVSALMKKPVNEEQYQIPLFANHGKRVDTSCIGYDILSCGINGEPTSVKSGTSMAAAYISGLIALKLQILTDHSIPFLPDLIIKELKTAVFGTAYRANDSKISLPVVHPMHFLTTK